MLAPSLRRLTLKLLSTAFILAAFVEGRPASEPNNGTAVAANSGDPKVHCERTNWYDICLFIFTNYILHALSVRSLPGENSYSSFVIRIACLLIPSTGLRRGLCLITRANAAADNDLQAAARARALCMVIRKSDWRPCVGDVVKGCELDVHEDATDIIAVNTGAETCTADNRKGDASGNSKEKADDGNGKGLTIQIKDPYTEPLRRGPMELIIKWLIETPGFRSWSPSASIVDHESTKIHGRCQLAEGYALSYVPGDMKVKARIPSSSGNATTQSSTQTRLACVHSFPRTLLSLSQSISGAYALYKARGSQIERYGFAAFGLTVIPYIVISIINFTGSLLSGEYETIFLVHSSIMDEMIARGGFSDGTVGSVDGATEDHTDTNLLDREVSIGSGGTAVKFEGSKELLRCVSSSNQSFKIEPLKTPAPKRWYFRWKHRYHGLLYYPVLTQKPALTTKDTPIEQGPPPKPKDAKQGRRQRWPWQKPTASAKDKISTISIPSHPPFTRLPPARHQTPLNLLAIILFLMAIATPYLIIGILSGFKSNKSTPLQRNFTLTWLICGQSQGYGLGESVEQWTRKKTALWGLLIVICFYGSSSVCGFFVVAQEMLEFGTCKAM